MSDAYHSIKAGLNEALDYARGNDNNAVVHRIAVPDPDVAKIRTGTKLSQREFARSIGVALGTLQGWEQGRRRPNGPARVLLALIAERPGIVREQLGG